MSRFSNKRARRFRIGVAATFMAGAMWFGWRRHLLVGLILAYLAFLYFLPSAPTVAVVHAKSEQVSFTVLIPEMARFRLPGFGVRPETALPPNLSVPVRAAATGGATSRVTAPRRVACLGGILQATEGTRVTIRRFQDGPVRILLERFDDKPVAEFRGQDASVVRDIQQASWLTLEETESCAGTAARRFPLSGIVEIGDELRPETSIDEPSSAPLIEGQVQIYGKTLDPSTLGRGTARFLYPALDISLPPGSRIAEASGPGAAGKQPWAGLVYVDADSIALQVEATTEAPALAILRPGVGMQPEILKIGMFAQLTNDPNIIVLQIAAAVIFALIQALGNSSGEERDPGDVET